jgi:hypothetical protein
VFGGDYKNHFYNLAAVSCSEHIAWEGQGSMWGGGDETKTCPKGVPLSEKTGRVA